MFDDVRQHSEEWTTTPPTEPGWYWVFTVGKELDLIEYDHSITAFGTDTPQPAWLYTHFLGPLPVPEPPHA